MGELTVTRKAHRTSPFNYVNHCFRQFDTFASVDNFYMNPSSIQQHFEQFSLVSIYNRGWGFVCCGKANEQDTRLLIKWYKLT